MKKTLIFLLQVAVFLAILQQLYLLGKNYAIKRLLPQTISVSTP